MKNKKRWITAAFLILAVAAFAGMLLLKNHWNMYGTKAYENYEDAAENAGFSLQYSDRLSGLPVTGFTGSSTSITVLYENAGYVRKTLISEKKDDTAAKDATTDGALEHVINGVTVYFSGNDDAVTDARWTDNGFDYQICIENASKAITADEMEDYVRMTQ